MINPHDIIVFAVGVIAGAALQAGHKPTHPKRCPCSDCSRTRWMMGEDPKPAVPQKKSCNGRHDIPQCTVCYPLAKPNPAATNIGH